MQALEVLNPIPLAINTNSDMEPGQSLRILLADDNPLNQQVCLFLLERLGYTADVVNNGLEVLQALQKQDYDIILMDVWMPGMDGITTTRLILSHYPNNHPIHERPRIIAVTADTDPNSREKYLSKGMDDYLRKPVLSRHLQSVIEKWGEPKIQPC